MTRPTPALTPSDAEYLAQLQRDVDAIRASLREFDRIVSDGATNDPLVREAFSVARGRFLSEIDQRKRSWAGFHPDLDAVSLLDCEV